MVSTRTDALGLVHEQAQLMFGFDAWPDPRGGTRMQQRVGEIFTGLCRDAGLEVDWDGDPEARITLVNLDWRAPLPLG